MPYIGVADVQGVVTHGNAWLFAIVWAGLMPVYGQGFLPKHGQDSCQSMGRDTWLCVVRKGPSAVPQGDHTVSRS
jgi:hypothetical protein